MWLTLLFVCFIANCPLLFAAEMSAKPSPADLNLPVQVIIPKGLIVGSKKQVHLDLNLGLASDRSLLIQKIDEWISLASDIDEAVDSKKSKEGIKTFGLKEKEESLRELKKQIALLDLAMNVKDPQALHFSYSMIRDLIYAFGSQFRPTAVLPLPSWSTAQREPGSESEKPLPLAWNFTVDSHAGDPKLNLKTSENFWRNPIDPKSDLTVFSQDHLSLLPHQICGYLARNENEDPRQSLLVDCGGEKLRFKLSLDAHIEPFNVRIFKALGFHTKEIDFVPFLKMRYDRRIFTQFNLAPSPKKSKDLGDYVDPFSLVDHVVLKDGTRWSGKELRQKLLRNLDVPSDFESLSLDKKVQLAPENQPGNFREFLEDQIDFIATRHGNIEGVGKGVIDLGPWDWNDPQHYGQPMVRGTVLLSAWLGNYKMGLDSHRLQLVLNSAGDKVLKYAFGDLAAGLGEANSSRYSSSDPNEFSWEFTNRTEAESDPLEKPKFQLTSFRPIEFNMAARQVSVEDARWMARQIGKLSEEQIKAALILAGYSSAHTKIFLEKLLYRRDKMLLDLGLSGEFAPSRKLDPKARQFDYDPAIDGVMQISLGEAVLKAPADGSVLRNGIFIEGTQ